MSASVLRDIINTKTTINEVVAAIVKSNLINQLSPNLSKIFKTSLIQCNLATYRFSSDDKFLPDGSKWNQTSYYWWIPGSTSTLREITNELLEQILEQASPSHWVYDDYQGHSRSKFHPEIPLSDLLTPDRETELKQLHTELNLHYVAPQNITELRCVINNVLSHINVDYPTEFRATATRKKRGKPSYRAVLPAINIPHRKLLSVLCGRLHKTFIPATHASSLKFGKLGLFAEVSDELLTADLNTTVVAICMSVELRYTRGFTIDTANRGAFSSIITKMLACIADSPTTNYNLLALLHPSYITRASNEHVMWMLTRCLRRMLTTFPALQQLWDTGIHACMLKGMMVARRGSGINSAAWNAIADTWNNLVRFVRKLCVSIKINVSDVPLFKVMRLTAGDQMKWANAAKDLDPTSEQSKALLRTDVDLRVYQTLCNVRVFGWSAFKENTYLRRFGWDVVEQPIAMLHMLSSIKKIYECVNKACVDNNADPMMYLHVVNNVGSSDYRFARDMICGVVVTGLSEASIQQLKQHGFAGANGWTGT